MPHCEFHDVYKVFVCFLGLASEKKLRKMQGKYFTKKCFLQKKCSLTLCYSCSSGSSLCSDNAAHVLFLWSFSLLNMWPFLRKAFLISKWNDNVESATCQIFSLSLVKAWKIRKILAFVTWRGSFSSTLIFLYIVYFFSFVERCIR